MAPATLDETRCFTMNDSGDTFGGGRGTFRATGGLDSGDLGGDGELARNRYDGNLRSMSHWSTNQTPHASCHGPNHLCSKRNSNHSMMPSECCALQKHTLPVRKPLALHRAHNPPRHQIGAKPEITRYRRATNHKTSPATRTSNNTSQQEVNNGTQVTRPRQSQCIVEPEVHLLQCVCRML